MSRAKCNILGDVFYILAKYGKMKVHKAQYLGERQKMQGNMHFFAVLWKTNLIKSASHYDDRLIKEKI